MYNEIHVTRHHGEKIFLEHDIRVVKQKTIVHVNVGSFSDRTRIKMRSFVNRQRGKIAIENCRIVSGCFTFELGETEDALSVVQALLDKLGRVVGAEELKRKQRASKTVRRATAAMQAYAA